MTVLAVTVGDPAGIGPEVTEKAIATLPAAASIIVVGPENIADPMARRLGKRAHSIAPFAGPLGRASAASGRAALDTLAAGIALCKSGQADGLVTAPISKHALALAGSNDRGHTEILAREMGTGPTAMAFFSPQLRTVLATVHVPLALAIKQLSAARIVEVAALFTAALRSHLGIADPNLALAALNPHAGEDGLLGDDEKLILEPAVAAARAAGVRLSGPYPADTLFRRAVDGEFDGVVALYHDQALIPVKLLGFGDAVNVTLGLTHPRTSPDHGTAYDIAGKDQARPAGMLSALELALELCVKR
ncbi:MAG TPA: 4-hydroxythreonine-4-phosphate dehydrogenase PdxA [Myxococcota bacterium]|nr:4-hydroxythreonine-4-phosphate dehydrogenase PdxA [Myxococcota bacterium]